MAFILKHNFERHRGVRRQKLICFKSSFSAFIVTNSSDIK